MTCVIRFDNVTKSYPLYHHFSMGLKNLILKPTSIKSFFNNKNYVAIENVSFEINKGESVALIGRNGAGKSTSLSLIAGVLSPTKGKVTVKGRVASMLELGGGFHPELTGRENIQLNASLLGLRKAQIKEKLEHIIEFSELAEFIDEPIRIYSSGMLAKLGFSVISQIDPDILIIDEVLSVGDIAFQKKCINVIEDFKKKGVTILLVSHDMGTIQKICDKVIWIENHKLKEVGDVDVVTNKYLNGFE
ncbi:ABC transporter ATP-binding protein [Enterobacter roggenkampii]|uniref:ABC transporter ATP-binding protein n=1 Tax=Enterobacter roggenkampii TaxID=1812935 RepID=UPI0013F3BF36|nr:ABC transporter ATP-binding protein [Enterobacter roggenkampii]MBF9817340.1 ABC transporter ATP-binding protein [Enterobacter roggenkampii]MCM7722426.1 ABC transporter ATP-binding protein [Enterobacter roggenkampii]NHA23160.1 ABC transporter ATP-binding protein [Enterobacter roggenkampii]HCM9147353.1 ABC transporter ATP-binding protein [Enterobacter roggenkampii]HDT2141271.1 ABC transporter ATP-binding protein [Enterobacter roggenkampii]